MYVYWGNLLLTAGLGIWLCEHKPSRAKTILYLFLCVTSMTIIYSLRYGMGYDFYSYLSIFNGVAEQPNLYTLLTKSAYKTYPLFALLNYGISWFTGNYTIVNFIYGIVIFGSMAYAVYRYSPMPWISMFSYVTLIFFYMSMNLVRQSIAVALLLFAYPYLKQRKIVPYMLVVLVCSAIHFYSLIMIPLYFFLILKPSKKHYGIMGIAASILFVVSGALLTSLSSVSSRIADYIDTKYLQTGSDFRITLIPIVCFIVLLSFKSLLMKRDSGNDVLVNIAFYGMLASLFSIRHVIISRFSFYFLIFMVFAFAEVAACLKPAEDAETKLYKGSAKSARLTLTASDKKQLKEQKFNYRWYVCSLVFILLINHSFASANGLHRVFPYKTIFDEKWKLQADYIYYEMDGAVGWPLRTIYESDFPEELR